MKIAIIGTRNTNSIERLFKTIKEGLDRKGVDYNELHIYSGNAEGVDQIANMFIPLGAHVTHFIPWDGQNKHLRIVGAKYINKGNDITYDTDISTLFPWVFSKESWFVKLIRRNMFIIQNADIIIWHTGRGVTGGTAYGVKYAQYLNKECVEIV